MYQISLFIFQRSLRLTDNTGLIEALKQSKQVLPIFIFTPEQIVKNPYKSNNAVQFMIESLKELDKELRAKKSRLFFFFGQPEKIIQKIILNKSIDAVFVNHDYTPYAIARDKKIETICKKNSVVFKQVHDILLHEISSIKNTVNKPYQKYTPYLREALKKPVKKTQKNRFNNYVAPSLSFDFEYKKNLDSFYKSNKAISVHGGRSNALKILKQIKIFKNYDKERNNLTYQTTMLAPYLKFGCISIREAMNTIKKIPSRELIRQLFWRDFYYNIAYHFPKIFGQSLKENFSYLSWNSNPKLFEAWKKGQTGFPIIDACMRELNQTGFMHNRGRLLTSSFLTKLLFIDWRKGEKYFAQQLTDYDPAVNNGNWQWVASCGADSQPYFRFFNPWLQSKQYDPSATFIKKWIPELKNLPAKAIHSWYLTYKNYKNINYPKPTIDYMRNKAINIKKFKAKS